MLSGRPYSGRMAWKKNIVVNEEADRVRGMNDPSGENLPSWERTGDSRSVS